MLKVYWENAVRGVLSRDKGSMKGFGISGGGSGLGTVRCVALRAITGAAFEGRNDVGVAFGVAGYTVTGLTGIIATRGVPIAP